jgi:hypothetical protein
MRYTLTILTLAAVGSACLLSGALSTRPKAPFDGYFVMQQNGVVPFEGVSGDGPEHYPLTNWLTVTSDSSPKVITSYLLAPQNSTAAPGQMWFFGSASYVNKAKVFTHPAQTNEPWSMPEWKTTNYWPMVSQHSELIYVIAIEKATAGRSKGQDVYAHCRVRLWGSTTAYVESDSWLLVSELTNTATLLKSR